MKLTHKREYRYIADITKNSRKDKKWELKLWGKKIERKDALTIAYSDSNVFPSWLKRLKNDINMCHYDTKLHDIEKLTSYHLSKFRK